MSRVIKSSQVNLVQQVVTKDLNDKQQNNCEQNLNDSNEEYEKIIIIAKKQAEDIVNDAIKEAGGIKQGVINDAKEELEKIKQEAYEEGYELGLSEGNAKGYEKGHQNGFTEGKEKSEVLIEEANSIKREYLNEKERTLNSIEKDVINLVVEITRKVLNQKIDEDDDLVVDLVLKGLESLNSKDNIRIRVSKDDFERVNASKEKILSKVSLIENLKVDMDSNLEKGDCVIESSKGNVDVSVDTQIKNVEQELKNLLDGE